MDIRNNLSLEDIIYLDDNGIQRVEKWRDIPDYEGLYMVSDLGRVKSLDKKKWNGKAFYDFYGRILKQNLDGHGYNLVGLFINKHQKSIKVHQLVAITFLKHKPSGFDVVVDHIDNNKLNNKLKNLQLISNRENVSKAIRLNKKNIYIGVSLTKSGKFAARIKFNKKDINLGSFKNEEEASEYYKNALNAINEGTEIVIKKQINSSSFKGVFLNSRNKKWSSTFYSNGNKKFIGYFITEQEAHEAREEWIEKNVDPKKLLNKYL